MLSLSFPFLFRLTMLLRPRDTWSRIQENHTVEMRRNTVGHPTINLPLVDDYNTHVWDFQKSHGGFSALRHIFPHQLSGPNRSPRIAETLLGACRIRSVSQVTILKLREFGKMMNHSWRYVWYYIIIIVHFCVISVLIKPDTVNAGSFFSLCFLELLHFHRALLAHSPGAAFR